MVLKHLYTHMYTYIHTYVHTYIHTYIIHAYITHTLAVVVSAAPAEVVRVVVQQYPFYKDVGCKGMRYGSNTTRDMVKITRYCLSSVMTSFVKGSQCYLYYYYHLVQDITIVNSINSSSR